MAHIINLLKMYKEFPDEKRKDDVIYSKFESFFRIIAERGLAFYQRRIISNLTLNAEERYEDFIDKYARIAQRVPQYALASYLGMTTEYLSRLRNPRIRKKS